MNEKFENLLNLALETPLEQRIQSETLNVGFLAETKSWELIVKYQGDLEPLTKQGIGVEELIAGYAILTVPEGMVEQIGNLPQIEYVEMPKRFFYEEMDFSTDPCIRQVTLGEPYLTGKGVMIAVLDSGIDPFSPYFCNAGGKTRIKYLWDQRGYTEQDINEALELNEEELRFLRVPSLDGSGHGSAVAAIAGASRYNGFRGIAPEADFCIVKLGSTDREGFLRTTQIMRGVAIALRQAREHAEPLVINLSFGNQYGAHDGSSLLERFLDNAAEIGKTSIFVGMGNDGNAAVHFAGNGKQTERVELAVASYERRLNVQLWKNSVDTYQIRLVSPSGKENVILRPGEYGKQSLDFGRSRVFAYAGEASPYSVCEELYLEWSGMDGDYVEEGVWTFMIQPIRVVEGSFDLYLSKGESFATGTGFVGAIPQATLTIPATASRVISVGAYDSLRDSYADFSGRGDRVWKQSSYQSAIRIKPDVVAPGVKVTTIGNAKEFISVDGTSFATPYAAGIGALLMEWGIVRERDPFLYGEKMKAFFRRNVKRIRGEEDYPNDKVGYGAICVEKINENMYN